MVNQVPCKWCGHLTWMSKSLTCGPCLNIYQAVAIKPEAVLKMLVELRVTQKIESLRAAETAVAKVEIEQQADAKIMEL